MNIIYNKHDALYISASMQLFSHDVQEDKSKYKSSFLLASH